MAEDFDVEALLDEAYYNKDKPKDIEKEPKKKHSRKRPRSRSHSNSRQTSGSRGRDERPRRRRSRSREAVEHKDRRPNSRARRTPSPPSNRVPLSELEPLTEEERDARTIFMRQLHKDVRPRDIENFFRPVGKIRDVRMITDRNSHRSKGISYVEFANIDSVSHALRMSGEKLMCQPVLIQPTMSEKNRAAMEAAALARQQGPTKLYVGNLHSNITEPMLRAIFEPFGTVDSVQLQYDPITGNSKGFGFVHFKEHDHARHAMEKLNGFELAGKPMKVGHVTERVELSTCIFDDEEADKGGIGMNAASRALLMQKLAANHGVDDMVQSVPVISTVNAPPVTGPTPCVLLSNMFNPNDETSKDWAQEIEQDIRKEVSLHATLAHIHVDKNSAEGNIYLRFTTTDGAQSVVSRLKGRLYAGRTIKTTPIPLSAYQTMFPMS